MSENTNQRDLQSGKLNDPQPANELDQQNGESIMPGMDRRMDRSQEEGQPGTGDPPVSDTKSSGQPADVPSKAKLMENPPQPQTLDAKENHTSPQPLKVTEFPWFDRDESNDLQSRWKTIQSQFVDEPCSAVEQGETLVAETVERLKQKLSDQQQALTQQWLNHDDITTEELRNTLLSYRSLLDHLLRQ